MESKQIIERLSDLSEKAETAHRIYRDQEAGKDAQALRAALEMFRPTEADVPETGAEAARAGVDDRLLQELCLIVEQFERSAAASPLAKAVMKSMLPGGPLVIDECMTRTKRQAVVLRQVYDRMGELIGGAR